MKINHAVMPEDGQERIIHKFALIPINIGRQTRWLERVSVKQKFKIKNTYAEKWARWINVEFIDD